uniref:Ig-like domain-containing protein n=1 Tax=Variovorax sp. E3 TaxID=1914993 RepID=UPI0018DB278E
MTTITITAKKSAASSTSSLNDIQLVEASVVQIRMPRSQIKGMKRVGDDLVVTSVAGEVITVHGFFTAFGGGKNDLVFEDSDANGALWLASLSDAQGELVAGFQGIDSIEPLLLHESFDLGMLPWIAGAGLLASAVGGGGGGGKGGAGPLPLLQPVTPDTTPPTAPTVKVTANATGAVVVTGQAEAGSTVSVNFPDGTVVKVIAGSDGSFSATSAAGRQPGGNVVVHATDPSGNQGPDTVVPFVMRDIDAPVAPSVTVNNGAALGGKGEPGSTVAVTDDKGHTTTTTVDNNGDWKIVPNPVGEGQGGTIIATDPAGNVSPPVGVVGGDHVAPGAPTVAPTNGSIVSGTAEADSIVTVKDGKGQTIGSGAADGSGHYSIKPGAPSSDGDTLSVTATDKAGNPSVPATVIVDGKAPQISVAFTSDTNGDGLLNATEVKAGVGVKVTLVSGAAVGDVITATGGTTTKTVTLSADDVTRGSVSIDLPAPTADGPYVVTVKSKDLAGNESTAAVQSVVVDTVSPVDGYQVAIVAYNDNFGVGLGDFGAGTVTNDDKPMLKGTSSGLVAGDSLRIYRDGVLVGSAEVAADDTWTYQSEVLANRNGYSFQAAIVDAAGNEGLRSNNFVFSVFVAGGALEEHSVAITAFEDHQDPGTGTFQSGAATNDAKPVLKGTLDGPSHADIIRIFENDVLLGTASILPDNKSWEFALGTTADGVHTYVAQYLDGAGDKLATSTPFALVVDTHAPSAADGYSVAITAYTDDVPLATGDFGTGTSTNDTKPVLKGTVAGLVQGDVVQVFEGTTLLGTASVTGQTWSFALAATSVGEHTYSARIVDAASNEGITSNAFSLTVDVQAPALPTVDPTNGTVVSGTAEAGSSVVVSDGAGKAIGSAVADVNGHYEIKPGTPSNDGDTLSVVSTDKAGNASTPATVTVDGKAPEVSIAIVADANGDGFINKAELGSGIGVKVTLVSGAAVGDVITATGGGTTKTVTLSADDVTRGSVSIDFPVPSTDGPFAVTVKSKDIAGNESSVTKQVVVDTTSPVDGYKVAVVSYYDNVEAQTGDFGQGTITNDQTPLLKGTSSGLVAGDFLHIYEGTTLLGNAKVGADGTWSYQLDKLSNNAAHSFHAIVVDAAGNEGLRSADFSFTVAAPEGDSGDFVVVITGFEDNVAPNTGMLTDGKTTNDPKPVLHGVLSGPDQGDSILIHENGVLLGTATILADKKSWEFKLDTVPDGAHAYVAELFSGAGDKITNSDPFQLVVDTHAPVAPTVGVNNGTGMGGIGEPGSTVTIKGDNDRVTTTTVDKNGNWQVTPNPVGEGQKGTVTATDPAGNVSPPVSVVGGDQVAPVAPTVTVNNGAGIGGKGE